MKAMTAFAISLMVFFLFLVCPANAGQAHRPSVATIKIGPATNLFYIEFSPEEFKLKILSAEEATPSSNSAGALFVNDYAERFKALAVISGGYMSSFSPPTPLGLVQVNGKILSRATRTWLGNGIVCIKGSKVEITAFRSIESRGYTDCLQSGPLFISSGRSRYQNTSDLPFGEERLLKSVQNQAFVCKNRQGIIVFGVTDAVRLDELVPIVIEKLKCTEALRMSGGATAALQVGEISYSAGELPVSNVLAFFQ